jgi:hypothetical protein
VAATLTFRPRLDGKRLNVREAQLAVRHYLRLLNADCFGKRALRGSAGLAVIPIREGGEGADDKHIHYHLQMAVPAGKATEQWLTEAAATWQKVRWASPDQNVFVEVEDEGWLSYITKFRDKPNFMDAVDVENLRLN